MAYQRSQRTRAFIRADPSPLPETRWDTLKWNQKQNLLGLTTSYWPPTPPVSPAQQAIYQQKAVVDFLPFYINDGGSRRDATLSKFYK